MITPFQKDQALLDDILKAPAEPETFHLWWLGQSGFLVKWEKRFLLIDPYLSDSLTRKYQETDKPHVRMTELVIDPHHLNFINLVTSSHNHTDHLDGETLTALREANPNLTILVPTANLEFAANRLGVPTDELKTIDADESQRFEGFTVHAIPSAHEELDRDEQGHYRYLGHIFEFGPFQIYHSGDTLLYEGMVERLQAFAIDIALLPINGRAPERRVAGNLNGAQAARLAMETGAKYVVPCHYDMFEFNTATTEEFKLVCNGIGQEFRVMENGEGITYSRSEGVLSGP